MSQKIPPASPKLRPAHPRPGQDFVVAKRQAAQFPNVGVTLRSYQYDARDKHGLPKADALKNGRWRRFREIVTIKRAILTILLLGVLIGGWVGGKLLYNAHKLFGGSIFSVLSTTKLKGEDTGRVNILLAGNSADDVGHNGAQLTDSIMILSVDTRNNTALLLSVPRDLWVHIPGDGYQKINAAYVVGQGNDFSQSGFPNGGMGMLEDIVQQDFGLPIDYYALIDYNAFRDTVNAVGGIDVNIQSSNPHGLYDPSIDFVTHGPLVKLTNGVHHLNGEQALDLARARGDAYGSYGFDAADFDRTQHQRQMFVALKQKAVSVGVLTNPAKLTSLSDAIGNNVKTDLNLSQVHRLYDLTKNVNSNNIKSLSLNSANGKDLLASYQAPDGESALIPAAGINDFSDIQYFVKQQTSSDPIVREAAKIVVLNATGTTGLAARMQQKLTASNLDIVAVGDARTNQATTSIIDASGGSKSNTRAALIKRFGNNVTTTNPYAGAYNADFIILLGTDQLTASNSATTD